MTMESDQQWHDLSASWKREAASMSLDELNLIATRMRRKMLIILIGQLLAAAVGLASALWLALFSPMRYVGWGTAGAIALFAAAAVRWKWRDQLIVGDTATKLLRIDLQREERLLDILSIGRVVILAALAAAVIATSNHLRQSHGDDLSTLLALLASSLYLVTAAMVGAWLARRARRRARVFQQMLAELEGETPRGMSIER